MFIQVKNVEYLGNYKLKVVFNDGKEGIIDLSDIFSKGKVFKQLKDKKEFSKVKLDKELGTIVWPNGVDLAPEYLYFLAFKYNKEL